MSFFLGDDEPASRDEPPLTNQGSGPGAAVAVVDADQAVRSRLAMQLGDFAVPVASIEALRERLTGIPLVAVLGPSCAAAEGIIAAEKLIADRPEVGAILIAPELSTELFRQALRAGIRDVLPAPVDTTQLADAVRRVVETLSTTRAPAVQSHVDPVGELGHVITVFSTKGGAGRSVIAANLAVVLARRPARGPLCSSTPTCSSATSP